MPRTPVVDLQPPWSHDRTWGELAREGLLVLLTVVGSIGVAGALHQATSDSKPAVSVAFDDGTLRISQSRVEGVPKGAAVIAVSGTGLDRDADSVKMLSQVEELLRGVRGDTLSLTLEVLGQGESAHDAGIGRMESIEAVIPLERPGPRIHWTAWPAVLTLVSALGLIVSRADGRSAARREFLLLCVAVGAAAVPLAAETIYDIRHPFAQLVPNPINSTLLVVVWAWLVGVLLLRLMVQLDETGSLLKEPRWLFGRRLFMVLAACILPLILISFAGSFSLSMLSFGTELGFLVSLGVLPLLVRGYRPDRIALGWIVAVSVIAVGLLGWIIYRVSGGRWGIAMDAFFLAEGAFGAILLALALVGIMVALGLALVLVLASVVLWPGLLLLVAQRLASMGGTAQLRARAIVLGIRSGAGAFLLFVVAFVALLVVIVVRMRQGTYEGGQPLLLSLTVAQIGVVVELLFLYAVLAPFLGAFLAVTRKGMWNADIIFRRSTTLALFGIGFFVLWECFSLVLQGLVPAAGGALGAAVASGGVLTVLRNPLASSAERMLFPKRAEIRPAVDRLVMDHRDGLDRPDLVTYLPELRARAVVGVRLERHDFGRASVIGVPSAPVATTLIAAVSTDRSEVIVEYPETTHFAFAVDSTGDGAPVARRAWVVIEPLRGARLYDERERAALAFGLRFLGNRLLPASPLRADQD